jgi:hypothetical protein
MERYLEVWAAYLQGGIEAMLPYCAPDIVVEEYASAPGAEIWHGPDGLLKMWRRWEEDLEGFAFEPAGPPTQLARDVFAAPVRVTGTGRTSGIEVDWNLIMVSVLRDGLFVHQFLAETLEEARARLP